MPNDSKQTDDREPIFEWVITEDEIDNFAHPNILVEDDLVTLKSLPPRLHTFSLAALYVMALIVAGQVGSVTGGAVSAVATLILIVGLVRQRVTTVFDRRQQAVYRWNRFQALGVIPFAEISEVAMAHYTSTVYFEIVLKADRRGKGLRLSRNYEAGNEEFLYMIMKARPAISSMLEESPGPATETDAARPDEHPVFFARNGSLYTFTTWRTQLCALVLSAAMLTGFACVDDWVRWPGLVIGVLAFLAAFIVDNRITIDAGEKTIRFSSLFGIFKTSLPLSRYSDLRVIHEHAGNIYLQTAVYMLFRDPELKRDFHWVIWTRNIRALVEETEAIIAAARAEPDQPAE